MTSTSTKTTIVAIVVIGLVVLAVIGAMAALTWHKTVTGHDFTTFIETLGIAGLVGGVGHFATNAGASAAASKQQ